MSRHQREGNVLGLKDGGREHQFLGSGSRGRGRWGAEGRGRVDGDVKMMDSSPARRLVVVQVVVDVLVGALPIGRVLHYDLRLHGGGRGAGRRRWVPMGLRYTRGAPGVHDERGCQNRGPRGSSAR
uniref:Uncharacterized protein n=1 Tax=Cacopsylla melanoneura TaxID=428564 RepID=A0A8D8RML6_9HEMI